MDKRPKNIFEPAAPLSDFDRPAADFQVNVDPLTDMTDRAAPAASPPAAERNYRWPAFIFIFLTVVLAFRLVNLQITNGQLFQVLAQGNRVETRRLPPPRGEIVDRTGQSLTKNVPIYNLTLYPAQLPRAKADREAVYQKIETVAGIKAQDIAVEVDKQGLRSIEPIILQANLERDTALLWQIRLGFVAGLQIESRPVRAYEPGLGLGHVLGYVGKVTDKELQQRSDRSLTDQTGKAGLELFYDDYLQGQEGKDEIEVDSKGQIQRLVSNQPALPGKTLDLYLDKDLQKVMAAALILGVKNAGKTKGVALAIDPQTGGVLGLVSLPDYDNNFFIQPDKQKERQALFDDPNQPLFNRAIAGVYPPGSTSKPVWATAGLSEGVISENTDIQTPPAITVGNFTFPDWKPHGHADVRTAIAESNNIFFYAVAGGFDKIKGLGPQKMKEWAFKFGWGQKTGIDLPGEAKGLLPDPDWKKKVIKQPWYIGDTYHEGIGQGYLAITPIQLVNSIVTIANGGTSYEPRLVKDIKDLNGKVVETTGKKIAAKNIADTNVLRIVREGMRRTVLEGSARSLQEIAMPIAGKTGTAQFGDQTQTHAWFVGFAPYDHPTITILVMVEGGGESFTVAVPIAKQILSWYSDHDYHPSTP